MNAAIYGVTGLIGSHLLEMLAADKRFTSVTVFSRTKPEKLPLNVHFEQYDISTPNVPDGTSVVFCALGTTLKKAGSRQQFEKIDRDGVVNLAIKCKEVKVDSFIYVSSIGARSESRNYYLRSKGLTESDLIKLEFNRLKIIRPSLLLGRRKESRFMESIAQKVMPLFNWVLIGPLVNYRPVKAETVARAMVELVFEPEDRIFVESVDIERIVNPVNKKSHKS